MVIQGRQNLASMNYQASFSLRANDVELSQETYIPEMDTREFVLRS